MCVCTTQSETCPFAMLFSFLLSLTHTFTFLFAHCRQIYAQWILNIAGLTVSALLLYSPGPAVFHCFVAEHRLMLLLLLHLHTLVIAHTTCKIDLKSQTLARTHARTHRSPILFRANGYIGKKCILNLDWWA